MQSDRKELIPYRAADPAQSAPSAPTGQDWNDACDFIKKNADPEATHLPYLEIANLVVTYAALRTAQLERELEEYKRGTFSQGLEVGRAKQRAETALRDARENVIQECAKLLCDCCTIDGEPTDMQKKSHDPYSDGERWVHEYEDGTTIDCAAQKLHTALGM